MKKLLVYFIIAITILNIILFLNTSAATLAQGTCGAEGNNLTWKLDSNGTLTISGTGNMANYDVSNSPWYSRAHRIRTLLVEDGVESIGNYAFASCCNLMKATLSQSVEIIGDFAFANCLFYTLPVSENIVTIGNHAFSGCRFESVSIPANVKNIGYGVFSNCKSLLSIDVDSNNEHYSSLDGILFNKNQTSLVMYPPFKYSTGYIIPDSVETIESYAFANCSRTDKVTIHKNITEIGDNAFYGSSFYIDVDSNNNNFLSENGVLFNKNKTQLIKFSTDNPYCNYSVPDSVTSIKKYAFSNCRNLKSIKLSDNIVEIEENSFSQCIYLMNVSIPNSILTIGKNAFYGCNNLTSITIPESVASIGDYAFYVCDNLKSITIPANVTYIGNYAFQSCTRLSDVYYSGTEEDWNILCSNIGSYNDYLLNANITFKNNNPFTSTTIISSGENISFDVSAYNLPKNDYIILSIYNNGKLIDLQKEKYIGNDITFKSTSDYDTAKVMIWKDLATIEPESEVEIITK